MPLSAEDKRIVQSWADSVSRDVQIRLSRTHDARSAEFEAFLDELRSLAPGIRVAMDDETESGLPGLAILENLLFQAIPAGYELMPFLDLLRAGIAARQGNAPEGLSEEPRLEWPAAIRVYVAPQCPHCPRAVGLIGPLALEDPRIVVTIIDGTLFPELAARDGIRSAPTTLLDEAFRWTGIPPMNELRRALVERDPSQLSAESLTRMLKDGEAERLAAMMADCGRMFSGFQRLLDHPEWSVRLGAVVVVEELAEKSMELARMHVEPVWERFTGLERPIQGDVIYLSGLVGPREWIPRLETLLRDEPSEDMREVLGEAIEAILSRQGA